MSSYQAAQSPYQATQPQEPRGNMHENYSTIQSQGSHGNIFESYHSAQSQESRENIHESYPVAQSQEPQGTMYGQEDYDDHRTRKSQSHRPPGGWRHHPYSSIERHGGPSRATFAREQSAYINPQSFYQEDLQARNNQATAYDQDEEETYHPEVDHSNQPVLVHMPTYDMRSQAPSPSPMPLTLSRPGTGPYNIAATPLLTGMPLIPGRFSGIGSPPPKVNKMPELVPQESVSDAALLKRGLKRTGEARVASRAVGATDPDNIMIINMFDNDRMTWTEIAQRMNQQRIMKGAKPNFTSNSCHNRYNRNAPLLYATDGREWVPVHKRNNYKRGVHLASEAQGTEAGEASSSDLADSSPFDEYNDNMETDQFTWDAQCDLALVHAKKRIDSQLWPSVAKLFHEKTGLRISPTIAANRFALI